LVFPACGARDEPLACPSCAVADFGTDRAEAPNATTTAVPAGSESWVWRRRRTRGAVTRPRVAPSVSCPQLSTSTVCPAVAVTADPLIASPVALPLPSVAWTLLAVTTPSNSETELSETAADVHVDPLAAAESKVRTER
jgi:hypothetical protein